MINSIRLLGTQHQKIQYYLLMLFCFFFPFFQRLAVFIITLLVLNWLLDKQTYSRLKQLIQPIPILFASFYLLYIFGLVYSQNMERAGLHLEQKLSLLIFPLLFFTTKIDNQKRANILFAFVLGCLMAIIFSLSKASYIYFTAGVNNFFYTDFSGHLNLHPAYYALYLSCTFFIYDFKKESLPFSKSVKPKIAQYSILILFSIIIAMLSSRAVIISFIIVLLTIYPYFKFKTKQLKEGLYIIVSTLIVMSLFMFSNPFTKSRVNDVAKELTTLSKKNTITNPRKDTWKASIQLIKHKPIIGHGSGDVRDLLQTEYKKNKDERISTRNFNSHNQFFEITVAFGLLGLVLFLAILGIPFLKAWQNDAYLYVFFLSLFILANLTESMLETQGGVVFFAFFNSFFASKLYETSTIK